MLSQCRIQIEDYGPIDAVAGELFLEVLNRNGLDLHNDCGGHLKCGKCRIVFQTPPPPPRPGDNRHLSAQELARGVRLACTHQIRSSGTIVIPEPPQLELEDDLTRKTADEA